MRKVIAIVLGAVIAVSATGCMDSNKSDSGPNIGNQSAVAAQQRAQRP